MIRMDYDPVGEWKSSGYIPIEHIYHWMEVDFGYTGTKQGYYRRYRSSDFQMNLLTQWTKYPLTTNVTYEPSLLASYK